jgi:hypothetical protein
MTYLIISFNAALTNGLASLALQSIAKEYGLQKQVSWRELIIKQV